MEALGEVSRLVEPELACARLGHAARSKRLVQVGCTLAGRGSDKSLPHAFGGWTPLKGCYRFLDNGHVTPESILSGHAERTALRCREVQGSGVLLVQDTMTLTPGCEVEGSGPVGPHGVQGLLVHTVLALEAAEGHEVLGVLAQRVWARPKRARGRRRTETGRQRKARPGRESARWGELALEASQALGPEAAGRPGRVMHVGDREEDVFETLEVLDALGDSFVIRACRNRRLVTAAGAPPDYLDAALGRAPLLGHHEVAVPAAPGRRARVARLSLRALEGVQLMPPSNRGRAGEPLCTNALLALEEAPPAGEAPLRWALLTREPLGSLEACVAVLHLYEGRWRIEEFHMGLKTGCGVEARELKTAERLSRFVALASVLAWGLLALRCAAREVPSPPAQDSLSPVQLQLLHALRPELPPAPDAHAALRALAGLGGFLGRKGDGEPGWRTLWRGLQHLLDVEEGYRLARAHLTPLDSG